MSALGLTGCLLLTKTTGPNKPVKHVYFYVGCDAYIFVPDWLKMGFDLWAELSKDVDMMERDFFLMKPAPGLQACRPRLARYTDAMACSKALFSHIRVPKWDVVENAWVPGGHEASLVSGSENYWSEHSARATMASWASAAGLSPDVLRRMGRWKGDVAAAYVRTEQALVTEGQKRIAKVIKEGKLIEDGIQGHFDAWCDAQGIGKLQLACVMSSTSSLRVTALTVLDADGGDDGDVDAPEELVRNWGTM
eukprot:2269629-Amphidinium_carterae.1